MTVLIALTPESLAARIPAWTERWNARSGGWALVVDADRTLAPVDTGRQIGEVFALNEAIRATFEALGYATAAFVRVSEIWSEVPADRYAAQIEQVAAEVAIYAGWQALFAACVPRIPVLVVSAGIPRVWRQILDRHGFPEVPVIGGCHSAFDEYVVCPRVKESLVLHLQASGLRVAAAGDSAIDGPMLRAADLPLLVADHKGSAALRRELAGDPRVRHLQLDERTFPEFETLGHEALRQLLLADPGGSRAPC